ncbi:hypothetical protein PFICI_07602 [Pestalotiopsis fici W106-1]|uniref:Intradiol ring-cleavage dioxygenases domain-containing protein n=1 Tax=Pestalotiopsis fici (strain W106-1 / CGMCC3.15140) TaxID=1229662 RepID=W3X1R0_PESFW|nr:uncharacterized protein PFICI_07602 [Pestalotiopsis fici W106-1]ETS80073.1 hypothetical protein PFICI_07602 [Pestalotiopsis fici W106-1]
MVAFSKVAVAAFAGLVAAHPGEKHDAHKLKREISARDNYARAQALQARSIQRRAKKVENLRQKRGITGAARKDKRDLADLQAWEAINHNQTGVYNYDSSTSPEDIFGANTSCILAPEVTDGPYYVVGEYLRSDVKESLYSEGVDTYLEVQYIDVTTCEPIKNVAVDIWNANATGVYSGIYTDGNYAADGLNSTYLRGVQLTDADGIVAFETIFPGHYDGRAVHTHLLAHTNASVQCNGTVSSWDAKVAHIGQLFWDDALRAEVEATYPYTENTQALTTNDDDMWSIVQADETYDPLPQYIYLGPSIEDGLFAWIQIGINGSADYTDDDYYSIAAYLDENGGHAESSSMGGDAGGDAGAGNGTAPSGTFSGTAPTGTAV